MLATDVRWYGRGSYIENSQLSESPLDIADLKCGCERYLEGFWCRRFCTAALVTSSTLLFVGEAKLSLEVHTCAYRGVFISFSLPIYRYKLHLYTIKKQSRISIISTRAAIAFGSSYRQSRPSSTLISS